MANEFNFFGDPATWKGPALGAISIDPSDPALPSSFSFPTSLGSTSTNFNTLTRGNANPFAVPTIGPPPIMPDISDLERLQEQRRRRKAIKEAEADFDALSASTRASGFQQADTAGNVYAQRLLQQGINPVASGVVTAQAKMPIFGKLNEIEAEKNKVSLDYGAKADEMAANIAKVIAEIQLSYSKSLADYNTTNAAFNLDLQKFDESKRNAAEQAAIEREKIAAARFSAEQQARSTGGVSGIGINPNLGNNFFPGYIPNSGSVIPGRGFLGANGGNVAVAY